MKAIVFALAVICCAQNLLVSAFAPAGPRLSRYVKSKQGVRGLTQVFDALAGLTVAAHLQSATISDYNPRWLSSTMPVAVTETKQGMYREYTVDRKDDSDLDKNIKTYKTAEETDDSKSKYWAILAVLLAGSFIIPMVQYYWYVADDQD